MTLQTITTQQTMSSREIAELTGKRTPFGRKLWRHLGPAQRAEMIESILGEFNE